MSNEELMSQLTEELKNYKPDFDKLKIWGDRGQMFTMDDIKKLMRRRPQPYAWYVSDLKRKRPHRKQGRNLYKGILAYRRRVGQPSQSKKGLGFRGVATMYDRMRIEAIRDRPELAKRIPDLFTRYMNVRFPVAEFHSKMLGLPPRNRGIDLHKYGLRDAVIKIDRPDNAWFVTPSMVTAGGDAVEKADAHDDAVMGIAMAMLRDE